MTSINTDTGMQMVALANQGGNSKMETKSQALGAPANVVSQGESAIKAWAEESGKVPGAVNGDGKGTENKMNNSASDTLQEQLEAGGISYDSYTQALAEGPEVAESMLKENDFSFDVKA